MGYHLAGLVNAVAYGFALYGLSAQLLILWKRRRLAACGQLREPVTAILSLNVFAVSFLGYCAFFVYGALIEPFNHYLVWTRLSGSLLVQAILFEIARERRERLPRLVFGASLFAMAMGIALLAAGPRVAAVEGRLAVQVVLVGVTALVLQGLAHQVAVIRRTGSTGAVSLRLYVGTSLKDLSLLAFGLAMGAGTGWPLTLIAAGSLALKAVLLWHFHWARVSPEAARRRTGVAAA